MSWIVETYIKRALLIRADMQNSIGVLDSEMFGFLPEVQSDIFSFEELYDDLLTIEIAIKELHKNGVINSRQLDIIKAISEGMSFIQVASKLNLHRRTVAENFIWSCKLIADHLGDHFTTEGYVDYIVNKYRLDEIKKDKLEKYLESKNHKKYWRDNVKS